MPERPKDSAEVREQAKALARLTSSLRLAGIIGGEVEDLRAESAARHLDLGVQRWDYHPSYCEIVRQCGAHGMFDAELSAALGCSQVALWQWAEAHPEFREAIDDARTLSKAYWERLGRKGVLTAGFNQALWALIMRAKFPTTPDGKPEYRERARVEKDEPPDQDVATPLHEISDDDLRAQIEKRRARIESRPWMSRPPKG